MNECPIDFGDTPYPCAFRENQRECTYKDGVCIPIHLEKFRKAMREKTTPHAILKCFNCGHEITLTEEECIKFQSAIWGCGECGFEQEVNPRRTTVDTSY